MRSLTLLIKPASGSCNMRCGYCFYSDVSNNRQIKNYGMMSLETLETLVKKAFSEVTELCVFGFQGGEPTLIGLDFYRTLIELERKYNIHNIKTAYSLQTNGLLINDEWAGFLSENKFLIGLSIDSDKQIHNMFRRDANGVETHNRCIKASEILKKRGAEFNILSVVTRALAAHPDRAYNFFKRRGFRYIQFIPCLDSLEETHGPDPHSLDVETYGNFLCRVFDMWYEDFVKGEYYSIRTFDNYIHMLAGRPPEDCSMGGSCSAYALVEANGGVYPCDFYAIDKYLLGNVSTHTFGEMLSGKTAETFISPSRLIHPDCAKCNFLRICRGGCRRNREPIIDGIPKLNYYCTAYKKFFEHALPRMIKIARTLF